MWNRSQLNLEHLPTDVYRVFDANNRLLYIGVSVNVFDRMNKHRSYAEWWPVASHGRVIRYRNRRIARHIEAVAIETEAPIYNCTRELSELTPVRVTAPMEDFTIFWEDGKVWVDAA